MTFSRGARRSSIVIAAALFAVGCVTESTGSQARLAADGAANAGGSLTVTKLTSNQKNVAPNRAPSLINGWGIVEFDGKFWIAANGSGDVVILDGKGVPSKGKPKSGAINLGEGITGVAVTGAKADDTAFQIHTAKDCKPAQLIFASETGKLLGVNTELSTKDVFVVVDQSRASANYKGVAVIQRTQGPYGTNGRLILAANFGGKGHVDVFNERFQLLEDKDISFNANFGEENGIFAPFNVMTFEDTVYVTYAKQNPANPGDDLPGAGFGFVVAFDTSGNTLGIAKEGLLNGPWGMALARGFGPFPNSLLISNFGDGTITAIEPRPTSGTALQQLGQLTDRKGAPITIEGLWGISLGGTVENARPEGLYFAAGPDDEKNGLFGVIAPKSAH